MPLLLFVPYPATIVRMKLLNLITVFFLLLPTPAVCQTITGKIVGIADGDTITVLSADRKQYTIRPSTALTPHRKGMPSGRLRLTIPAILQRSFL